MSRTAKQILLERKRDREALALPDGPTPFSDDHKVWPQGWSWAMIKREAERRYRSARDEKRQFDWTWAVDHEAVRKRLSKEAIKAAHELYDHQQTARGDIEQLEEVAYVGGFHYLGVSWTQTRSAVIEENAKRYVRLHPEISEARWKVFELLFDVRQPTLEEIRWRAGGARFNAKGKQVRLSQRETSDRIVWCCERLADCGAGLDAGYGSAMVAA